MLKTPFTTLIVDDEEEICELLALDLQELGHRVLIAHNGVQALEQLEKENFDLVVSDIRMPKMNGIELLKSIRSKYGAQPAVVFMSGFIDMPIWEIFDLGAQAFLGKPFLVKDLSMQIEKIFANSEQKWSSTQLKTERNFFAVYESLEKAKGRFALGSGGFYSDQNYLDFDRGDLINFKINFLNDPSRNLEGIGIIKWIRPEANGQTGGCGIEFISLSDSCRAKTIQIIKDQKIAKHIPKI